MNEEICEFRNVTLDKGRMHISGKGEDYNPEGSRNFTIMYDAENDIELVDNLIARNWPIKKTFDEEGNLLAIRLKVIIKYNNFSTPSFEMLIPQPLFNKNGQQFMENPKGQVIVVPRDQVTKAKSEGCTVMYDYDSVDLDEEASKAIDRWSITNVKVQANLSTYKVGNKNGYCVYLKAMQFIKLPSPFSHDSDVQNASRIHPEIAGDIATNDLPFDAD